jgi:hypothetical protein
MSTHKATGVTIDEYELPKGRNAAGAVLTTALLILSANRRFVEPRSLLHDQVLARSAKVHKHRHRGQDILFYAIYGLSGIQTLWFALTKARQHNLKRFSVVWFQWLLTIFLGGPFAQKHWDEVVEKKELKTIKEI